VVAIVGDRSPGESAACKHYGLQAAQWAFHTLGTLAQDMGIDLGCFYIGVAQLLLNGTNIRAGLQ
jgi:hypothetical protein